MGNSWLRQHLIRKLIKSINQPWEISMIGWRAPCHASEVGPMDVLCGYVCVCPYVGVCHPMFHSFIITSVTTVQGFVIRLWPTIIWGDLNEGAITPSSSHWKSKRILKYNVRKKSCNTDEQLSERGSHGKKPKAVKTTMFKQNNEKPNSPTQCKKFLNAPGYSVSDGRNFTRCFLLLLFSFIFLVFSFLIIYITKIKYF